MYGVGRRAGLDAVELDAEGDAAAFLSDALLNGVGGNNRFGVASAVAYGGTLGAGAIDDAEAVDVATSLALG